MEIKDYLHLYMGCRCQRMGQEDNSQTFKLTGISWDGTQNILWAYFEDQEDCYSVIDDVFPILRQLSSMTEEEASDIWHATGGRYVVTNPKHVLTSIGHENFTSPREWFAITRLLLSKSFDLFNLIENGLAIDIETIKQ